MGLIWILKGTGYSTTMNRLVYKYYLNEVRPLKQEWYMKSALQ